MIRKALKRAPEPDEVQHLNIMPMMDMMTILLVTFIFQVSTGAAAINAGNVNLPGAVSQEPMPEAARVIIISDTNVTVQGRQVASISGGEISARDKKDGASGMQVPALTAFLHRLRLEDEASLRAAGKKIPDVAEIMIIADRATHYFTLLSVMLSAKKEPALYKRFRFITLKNTSPGN